MNWWWKKKQKEEEKCAWRSRWVASWQPQTEGQQLDKFFFYQTRLYQNEAEPKRIKHAIQCKKVLTWDHGTGLKCCDMPRVTKISKLFSGSVQYIVLTCDYWNVELLFCLEETEPFSKKRASFFFFLNITLCSKLCHAVILKYCSWMEGPITEWQDSNSFLFFSFLAQFK